MTLYTRALNLAHRLTGREAAALRYQRDAHAEEAGRERQWRMAAERSAAAFRSALRAITLSMTPGDDIHRQVTARAIKAAAAALRAENPMMHLDIAAVCSWIAAGRERDTAVALLQALVGAREPVAVESALADAQTWLQGRAPKGAAEFEGSRGGLAWMPGEYGDEETLPSAGDKSR